MTTQSRGMMDRMKGAAALDIETFEEVEHDETATGQAAAVVMAVAVCEAVGASGSGLVGAVGSGILTLCAWLLFAGITYLVGEKIFQGRATWGEVLRTLGFAQAPGVLYLLGVVPVLGWFASVGVSIWILVASFIGIRQALDIGNFRTFLAILVGGGVYSFLTLFPVFSLLTP